MTPTADANGNFTATIDLPSGPNTRRDVNGVGFGDVQLTATWTDPTRAVVTQQATVRIGTSANPIALETTISADAPGVEFGLVATFAAGSGGGPIPVDVAAAPVAADAAPPAPVGIIADIVVKRIDAALCGQLAACQAVFGPNPRVRFGAADGFGTANAFTPNATEEQLLSQDADTICTGVPVGGDLPPWDACRYALPEAAVFAIMACTDDSCSALFRCGS